MGTPATPQLQMGRRTGDQYHFLRHQATRPSDRERSKSASLTTSWKIALLMRWIATTGPVKSTATICASSVPWLSITAATLKIWRGCQALLWEISRNAIRQEEALWCKTERTSWSGTPLWSQYLCICIGVHQARWRGGRWKQYRTRKYSTRHCCTIDSPLPLPLPEYSLPQPVPESLFLY